MNSNRSSKLVLYVVLALLAVCFAVRQARAQALEGKFTLPFETRWGPAVLPEGDYTLVLDHKAGYDLINIPTRHFARDTGGQRELIRVRSCYGAARCPDRLGSGSSRRVSSQ